MANGKPLTDAEQMFADAEAFGFGSSPPPPPQSPHASPAQSGLDIDTADAMFDAAETTGAQPVGRTGMTSADALGKVDSGDTEIWKLETLARTLVDGITVGSGDKIYAAMGVAADVLRGNIGVGGLSKNIADNYDEAVLDNQVARYANPVTALAGDVVGGAVAGGGMVKLGVKALDKAAPSVLRYISNASSLVRAGAAGTVAGGEAFVYRVNKDNGNLERAAIDAGLAFVGGTAVSGVLSLAGGVLRQLGRTPNVEVNEAIGSETMSIINAQNKRAGKPELKPSDVAAMLERSPDGTSVLDLFPDLLTAAKSVVSTHGVTGGADELLGLIATRSAIANDLATPDGFMAGFSRMTGVRSASQIDDLVKARFKRLQPKYTAALNANRNTPIDAKQLGLDMSAVFGNDGGVLTNSQATVMLAVSRNIKAALARNKTKNSAGKLVPATDLTPHQLQDLVDSLGKDISNGSVRTSGKDLPEALDSKGVLDLTKIKNLLSDKLEAAVPEIGALNRVYSNAARVRGAYEAGNDFLKSSAKDIPSVGKYLRGANKSAGEVTAFLEGAKYNLYSQVLSKAKEEGTAKAFKAVMLDNSLIKTKLSAIMGPDEANKMIEAMRPTIEMGLVYEGLRSVAEKGVSFTTAKSPGAMQALIDAGIAFGTKSSGRLSGSQAGAARRGLMSLAPPARSGAALTSAEAAAGSSLLGTTGAHGAGGFHSLQTLIDQTMTAGQSKNLMSSAAATAGLQHGLDSGRQSPD